MIYNVIRPKKKTTPISDVAVGSSVYCKVDGVRTEFLIVQKGNPDTSIYDSSCDGIWLLAKSLSDKSIYYDRYYTYEARIDLWKYLNNTLRPKLDISSIIKEAKVPCYDGNQQDHTIQILSPIFPLSVTEMGAQNHYGATEGKKLDYFVYEFTDEAQSNAKRVAYVSGTSDVGNYWTRTCNYRYYYIYGIYTNGLLANNNANESQYVRPCFIVPSDTKIDASGNILV